MNTHTQKPVSPSAPEGHSEDEVRTWLLQMIRLIAAEVADVLQERLVDAAKDPQRSCLGGQRRNSCGDNLDLKKA